LGAILLSQIPDFFNRPQPEAFLACGVQGSLAASEKEIPTHPPKAEGSFRMRTLYEKTLDHLEIEIFPCLSYNHSAKGWLGTVKILPCMDVGGGHLPILNQRKRLGRDISRR
jgi:hypothetical protein